MPKDITEYFPNRLMHKFEKITKIKTAGIHQPNFFPWLGFFDKIYKSDVFIFLDHVANNPRSAIWTKRVKILLNGSEHWLTLGLKSEKNSVFVPINEMEIDKPLVQAGKHLKTIELNYKKSPFFNEVFPLIAQFYEHQSPYIAERNMDFIVRASNLLGIETEKIKSSGMNCNGQSNELLIEICKKCNASAYMPGGGSSGYQEDEIFMNNLIELKYQNFIHPHYSQFNSAVFVPGLSGIDAFMNLGFEGVKKLLKIENK